MKMSKYRVVYIVSLVILGVLIVFTIFRPMATGEEYTEVAREHLLQTENEYIIEFHIMNHEGEDKKYTINVLMDGELYSKEILVPDGRIFTYVHHVQPDRIIEPNVRVTIYKEGEDTPFEQITYYID